MLNPYELPNREFPYEPLPPVAYEAARTSILKLDFPQSAILNEYSFSSCHNKTHTVKINALAFMHPVHRNPAEYAGITLYNAANGQDNDTIVKTLAESSALFHLIHRDGQFCFWASSVTKDNKARPIRIQDNISYDQLDTVLSNYAVDLNPKRIIDVKQGRDTFTLPIFRENIPALQLSLWTVDVTRKLLVEHFAFAVDELRYYARDHREIGAYDEALTRIAIQLLGAVILADTGVLGDNLRLNTVSMDELMAAAQAKFERYFQKELFIQYKEAAEKAYVVLRQIRFAGFVPDMLSEIYTKAFSKEQRKKLGRFETPLYLTRRILENIPVEYLAPDQRVIADMTCGWGSFLIAGHERLSKLVDTEPSSLRQFLRGNDIDPFTAQLAGLGLLLATSEDSWFIDHGDVLEWDWLRTNQPNIIVGNPPFEASRGMTDTGERRWQEKANKFLEYALQRLAPNGYLAMIMPASFTSSLASLKLREQLLQNCDILELWELPIEVFKDVTVHTIVLFAQKHAEKSNPQFMRVRTVQPNTLDSFKRSAIFTVSDTAHNQSSQDENTQKQNNAKSIIDYKLILSKASWQAIQSYCTNLQDYVEIIQGASFSKAENRRWIDYPNPKPVPLLKGVRKAIPRTFFIDYSKATVIQYPNDLGEPRKDKRYPEKDKEHLLAGTKVLFPYDPYPSWGKRNKVAIERNGYYVSNSFWVIAPTLEAQHKHITHEVVAAVLNWDVCNAWILEHLKSSAIPKRALETMPFPVNLSEGDRTILTDMVRKIEDLARANESVPVEITQLIDNIFKEAYHIDETTFKRLRAITEWDKNSVVTLDRQPDRTKINWTLSGVVTSVDGEKATITLWLEGFDELQTVPIVPSMPGWMLRSGAAFSTRISEDYLEDGNLDQAVIDWDTFIPQSYTYLSGEELLAKFTAIAK